MLQKLAGKEVKFTAHDEYGTASMKKKLENCRAPEVVSLKEGAQVQRVRSVCTQWPRLWDR
jgi:hypothetical protein